MDEKDEFTVQDRRSNATGSRAAQPAKEPASTGETQPGAAQDMGFSAFVISLASSVQVNLGVMPHPETNQTAQNFPAAKHMIDILALLQTKTKGNLNEAEAALLEQVLYSLRMHYVRAVEGQKKSGG